MQGGDEARAGASMEEEAKGRPGGSRGELDKSSPAPQREGLWSRSKGGSGSITATSRCAHLRLHAS